jgi:hypothetical protein
MKLKRFNDWGSIYYAEEGKGLRDGYASTSNGVELRDGAPMRVTWPDGTQEVLPLVAKPHTDRINDMAHEYDVRSKVFGFNVTTRGATVWVPVEETDVEFVDGATS